MTGIWWAILACFTAVLAPASAVSAWRFIVPFSGAPMPCLDLSGHAPQCFHSYTGYLTYGFMVQAIQLNVMLFLFNVFFPMYPMDGAKLIVCSLQLFCGASAQCAARVLIYTSTPLAILFIAMAFKSMHSAGGSSVQPELSAYMGFMCLSESYKIYKLMKEERLYTHPLFELARSSTREVDDGTGIARRLNLSNRDDEETGGGVPARARMPGVTAMELKPFSGSGQALGGQATAGMSAAGQSLGSAPNPPGGGGGRSAWLTRVEADSSNRQKTVRQLEEERLAQRDAERQRLTQGA
eukprot:CAMPEP_0206605290 /NCGR_PEP_ID=MMETSP0325_2-20121206/50300_1 /ASSEMBLY_ACC=CAM_ASM_000347 /TAXON_ID=2866 /ORGANISM="Crypthecodinium cohnii, Strain Seligo" /LENGTH=295 /DNA_ID=CAMNT_0054120751 /DNA_START=42 /DNA_END=929 /DNA_ORIENTATION=-